MNRLKVWIDENSDPDYVTLKEREFTDLFFSARDPRVTFRYLADVRSRGFATHLYRVPEWDATLGPREWARLCSSDIARVGGSNLPALSFQADIETHDLEWVKAFLAEWRRLRPYRSTSLAIEGFQGGNVVKILPEIVAANVTLVPECYAGDMTPFDTDGVRADLLAYKFPPERIELFHDAERLFRGWSGYAFTQQRLVSKSFFSRLFRR